MIRIMVKTPFRDFLQINPMGVRNSKFLDIIPGHKGLIIILHCMATIQPHCKKKVNDFPVPSRDVTYQTHPGREYNLVNLIIPGQGEFG